MTPADALAEIRKALETLVDEAPGSVEYSDWPELQAAVEKGGEALTVLDSMETVEGVRAEITPGKGRRFTIYEGATAAFDDERPALLLTMKEES